MAEKDFLMRVEVKAFGRVDQVEDIIDDEIVAEHGTDDASLRVPTLRRKTICAGGIDHRDILPCNASLPNQIAQSIDSGLQGP